VRRQAKQSLSLTILTKKVSACLDEQGDMKFDFNLMFDKHDFDMFDYFI